MRLAPSAEIALRRHSWPGNVRELENVMQRAVIFATGDTVEADALHLMVSPVAKVPPAIADSAAMPPGVSQPADASRPNNMRDLEREHILRTLAELGGSRKLTIERLGISERTLRYKLQQYRDEGYFKG